MGGVGVQGRVKTVDAEAGVEGREGGREAERVGGAGCQGAGRLGCYFSPIPSG